MLNWIDLCIGMFFVVAFVLEFRRGFGKAIFDLAALLVALRMTWELNDVLSRALQLAANPHTNEAALYALGFVIISVVLVCIGRFIHATTLVSADLFEPMLGCLCGLAMATIASHVLVQTIALSSRGDAAPVMLASSMFGDEFLSFDTYHQVLHILYNFHRNPVT